MTLEAVIKRFCSYCINEREQTGNARTTENTGCSRCSHCSPELNVPLQVVPKPKEIDLPAFVGRCCYGSKVSPKQVIYDLLSSEDRQDIINGDISVECLRAHIEEWINQKMPHYATRKASNYTPNRGDQD